MGSTHRLWHIEIAEVFALVALMVGLIVPSDSRGATDPGWVFTGSLNIARSVHTATLLLTGKVLVVGGKTTGNEATASAELYDPAPGSWSRTGSLSATRYGHTATLLPDGRVLVAGGFAAARDTAEIYDPATGAWTATGKMTAPRALHTATLLANGKVLIASGWDLVPSSIPRITIATPQSELFDPATGTWSRTTDLNVARIAHTATLLQDGRVLVAGGTDDFEFAGTIVSAELYDPITGTWTTTGNLNIGRNSYTATLLRNGKVLVAAGWPNLSAELYDPATARWTATGTLNSYTGGFMGLIGHTATLLTTGDPLVVGGEGFLAGTGTPTTSADTYSVDSGMWSVNSHTTVPRTGHTATLLRDGSVLVVGGGITFIHINVAQSTAELHASTAPIPIGAGFTGSWYDPAQSGHGLFVQVLSDKRFYASWFTFNPAGTQQAWFTGVGTYSGNTATIVGVEQPTGGRWIPNFDPTQIVHNTWGTLTFTFSDCNHGKVDFNSVAGYGTGSMNLTRLTQPAGLTCP